MKNKILILTLVVTTFAAVGCKKSSPTDDNTPAVDTNPPAVTQDLQNATGLVTNAWQKTKEATTNVLEDMKEGATNMWADIESSLSATTNYTYEKKDAFVAGATNDIAVLDLRIQALADQVATASDSVKADAQVKLQELRAKRAVLDQKLTDLKNSTEANWDDVKTGFQTSYDDTKSSVKTAWQWLKDKTSQ